MAEKHGGSLKAEHGTGRNVAPFVEMEWGPAAYALMWELKEARVRARRCWEGRAVGRVGRPVRRHRLVSLLTRGATSPQPHPSCSTPPTF